MKFFFFSFLLVASALASGAPGVSEASASNAPSWPPTAISVSIARADRVAMTIRRLFPKAVVKVDNDANTLIVIASPDDVNAIRRVVSAIDVRGPQKPTTEAIVSNTELASTLVQKIGPLFPLARISVAGKKTLFVTAKPADLVQIRLLISALDMPLSAPTPALSLPAVAFPITQGQPTTIARAVARAFPRAKVAVSGSALLVIGSADDITQVKALVEQLDRPPINAPYVNIYRLTAVDATSVAAVLGRAFSSLRFEVTRDVNAISVNATAAQHSRIANAITQLDVNELPGAQTGGFAMPSGNEFEIIHLRAAVPSTSGSGSSSASDIAQTVMQALAATAPDLKITIEPNSTTLVLSGSSRSKDLARDLIMQLDVAEPLVELDTRVLEVDEGAQNQLGLKFPTPTLATTYSEITPASDASANFLRLQGLTRTPLTLGAQLDFLVSSNQAKILEDPRITTFSGRTATLRAGETVNILTTAGGGSGTVATTQVQSFQTGVTLDITPVVNQDRYITVTLHPSVNTIAGIGTSGVPNIQTRDTTTTIGLHDGETLVIGGLIEDSDTKTVQKIPLLGDLPLIGRLFQDVGTNHTRNELVITVTPHILEPGQSGSVSHLSSLPAESRLPRLSPKATMPPVIPTRGDLSSTERISQSQRDGGTSGLSANGTAPIPNTSAYPSAFSEANTFVFGAPPTNNFASPEQPPRIFYVRVQPTVLRRGTGFTISALTTTNVTALTLSNMNSPEAVSIANVGAGKWQFTTTFDGSLLTNTSGDVSLVLTASTSRGTSTNVSLPFTLLDK